LFISLKGARLTRNCWVPIKFPPNQRLQMCLWVWL